MWKGRSFCCNRETVCMGTRWRFPSPKASKNIWKRNLEKLIWRVYDPDIEKLYKKYNTKYELRKGCKR